MTTPDRLAAAKTNVHAGKPALALLRLAEATEAQARAEGIPAHLHVAAGMNRLIEHHGVLVARRQGRRAA